MSRSGVARVFGVAAALAATPVLAQTFDDDVAFLRKHTTVLVLRGDQTGARVAVCKLWVRRSTGKPPQSPSSRFRCASTRSGSTAE